MSNLPKLTFKDTKISDGIKWQLKELLSLKFIDNDENIIITGDCATGKTSIACDIANAAISKFHKVRYINYYDYLLVIRTKDTTRNSSKIYKYLKACDLIIIDEFLYSNISLEELDLFYKSIMFFNETRSIIFITNRKLAEMDKASNDKHMIKTLIDRIKFNSHIVTL